MKSDFAPQQRMIFWGKSRGLIARQWVRNIGLQKPQIDPDKHWQTADNILAQDVSALYPPIADEEAALQLGKVQNLRIVSQMIDGITLNKGEVFSFWQAVGRPTKAKGFVPGRELRQGCIIPTIAGGICQFSNALSRVASDAGMEIVERHRHSAPVDGIERDENSDATLFWNYLDFRFRATCAVGIAVTLSAEDLRVALHRLPE